MSERRIQRVERARELVLQRRQVLRDQYAVTKERLQPAHLIADAKGLARDQVHQLKADTIDHAKAHPVATTLGIVALGAWLARKPLLAHAPNAVKRTYYWISGMVNGDPNIQDEGEDAYIGYDDGRR